MIVYKQSTAKLFDLLLGLFIELKNSC